MDKTLFIIIPVIVPLIILTIGYVVKMKRMVHLGSILTALFAVIMVVFVLL